VIRLSLTSRRICRDIAAAGAFLSAAMLMVGLVSDHHAIAAGTNAGAVRLLAPPGGADAGSPVNSGVSATEFALTPPTGAACSGDSATDGFRVQSYMVPANVDPSTLTFNNQGPIPQDIGANLRLPLISATGDPFINVTTAVTTGLLTNLPITSLNRLRALGGPAVVPAGTYNIGYACTKGTASATQEDRFWNVQIQISADPNDAPSGLAFSVVGASSTTTTTSSTSSTSTTSTTVAPQGNGTTSTSSTVPRSSTSSSTSSSLAVQSGAPGGSSSGTSSSSQSSSSTSSSSTLSVTGTTPVPLLFWAILMLVFGRIAVLLGRPIRVLDDNGR
jgi:hypothetical protein